MKTILLAALAAIAVSANGQVPDPKQLTKEFFESGQALKGLDEKARNKHFADFQAKVRNLLPELSPSKIDLRTALDWVSVMNLCQDGSDTDTVFNRPIHELLQAFLKTNPAPNEKVSCQYQLIDSGIAIGDIDTVIEVIRTIRPIDAGMRVQTQFSVLSKIGQIAEAKGADEALSILDSFEQNNPQPTLKELTDWLFDSYKDSPNRPKMSDAELRKACEKNCAFRLEALQQEGTLSRAAVLKVQGRYQAAADLIRNYRATHTDINATNKEVLDRNIRQIEIFGKEALPLKTERTIGNFRPLDKLKGKVVLVNYFAHWCGFCLMEMKGFGPIYAKLHNKGLEIVSVTQFYGYYKQEKNLSKPVEFKKLAGLLKGYNVTWPVVVGPLSNFTQNGTTDYPDAMLIGKDGKVRKFWVGYSGPDEAKEIEAEVEKALKE